MALQSSGQPIAFSDIENEFGPNPKRSLGRYRVSETYGEMTNVALDRGIPQSGTIAFSDFYDKRLNMVVNFYDNLNGGGADVEEKQNMKTKFNVDIDANKVKSVGGFLPPTSTTGGPLQQLQNHKRVIINVSKIIAPRINSGYKPNKGTWEGYNPDPPNNQNEVSMVTGNWDLNTKLDLYVGPSGYIVGAGGAGGKNGHGNFGENGPGDRGTSALGVTYSLNIYNHGKIAGGGGGGGGSPTSFIFDRRRTADTFLGVPTGKRNRARFDRAVDGGAGGGGAGYPPGVSGAQRQHQATPLAKDGTLDNGGTGGSADRRNRTNFGSPGANGGALGAVGGSIGRLGIGGNAGHAIIISGGVNVSIKEDPNGGILGGTHTGQFTF